MVAIVIVVVRVVDRCLAVVRNLVSSIVPDILSLGSVGLGVGSVWICVLRLLWSTPVI